MSQSELVVLLIVLVSSAILLAIFARIFFNYAVVEDLSCGAQVREANVRNRIMGRDEAVEIPACQPIYTTIKRSELPNDPVKADLVIKKKLADAMVRCWRNWGEGELDLFNSPGQYCSICADIKFDGDTLLMYPDNEIPDFGKYLDDTDAPGSDLKYASVLTGNRPPEANLPVATYSVPLNGGVTIMYSHQKVRTEGLYVQDLADKVGIDLSPEKAGIVAGAAAGIAEWVSPGVLLKGVLKTGIAAKSAAVGATAADIEASMLLARSQKLMQQSNVLRSESIAQDFFAYSQAGRNAQAARDGSKLLAKNAANEKILADRTLGDAIDSYATSGELRVQSSKLVKSSVSQAGGFTMGALTAVKDSSVSGGQVALIAYWYTRLNEEFTVGSATYITATNADNEYVEMCNTLGSPVASP